MAASLQLLTSYCANRRYSYEPEYLRDPSLSFLENIQQYFNCPAAQLQKIGEMVKEDGSVQEMFSIRGVLGRTIKFSIRPYQYGGYMFGWDHERCQEQRSWQYIVRDIGTVYSSGFY